MVYAVCTCAFGMACVHWYMWGVGVWGAGMVFVCDVYVCRCEHDMVCVYVVWYVRCV